MLHIHRAERADGLVEALRELLRDSPADPFAPELVAVPTRGMERWLAQRMSGCLGVSAGHGDGVCANVEFPSPHRLVADAVAAASGVDPETDPWLVEHDLWPLLDVVEDCLEEPWMLNLAVHLGAGEEDPDQSRRSRRLGAVRHIAELFDRYALHRPDMVRAWARGEDRDGAHGALPDEALWQAELWRRLRERIGIPGPAERLEQACVRLREEPEIVDLPARLSLFGLTRLPAGRIAVLRALAHRRDVHLFLLHPSPVLWEEIAKAHLPAITRRKDDVTATLPANSLLASWGQDARELQLVIGADDDQIDHHHPVEQHGDSLLGRIQQDVRADRSPPGAPLRGEPDARPTFDSIDRSVQVHACHGRARQVEVARDAILHMLQDDPSLEPRDVIVMCPDIETFAPLIHATFGVGALLQDDDDPDDAAVDTGLPDLRVRLADRALRQTNPVLGVVAQLLDLTGGRLTASQVLDLADRDPVRKRFGFDDDDLTRIGEWIAEGGIRWGLDAAHRAPFKLESLAAGTWRAGVDRLLVGVAMTEDGHRLYEGVLALDDVESGAIELAGRFAEFVDRLGDTLDNLSRPQTVGEWAGQIAEAADALTATSPRDSWQRAELQRLLDDVATQAKVGGRADTTRLVPSEVRSLFAERLQGWPTRANFRTGHLTICTLVPMRSVPHRVVCLLGLDDGAFPRKSHRDGDDLMLADPHIGDRDSRTEDRQMLLDALMAATDRLIITYTGNDERTNMPRPPAVPVGELLDVIDRTVRLEDGKDARSQVVVRHPLQPFDPRNFDSRTERPWSFDRVALGGARAIVAPRTGVAPFLRAPLADAAGPIVELENLVKFVERPVRAFLRQRLGISVADYDEDVSDALPIELDGLEVWAVGQRLVEGLLGGADIDACVAAEIARGTLPPGALSAQVIRRVRPTVEGIAAQAAALLGAAGEPGSVDVNALIGPGPLPARDGARGARGCARCRDVLARESAPPASRLGAPTGPDRFAPGTALRGRDDRPGAARRREGRARDDRADPAARGRPNDPPGTSAQHPREAGRRLRPRDARGAADRVPQLGGVRAGVQARHEPRRRRARRVGVDVELRPRGSRARSPARARGRANVRRAAGRTAAARRAGRRLGRNGPTRFGRYAHRMWDDLLAQEELTDR